MPGRGEESGVGTMILCAHLGHGTSAPALRSAIFMSVAHFGQAKRIDISHVQRSVANLDPVEVGAPRAFRAQPATVRLGQQSLGFPHFLQLKRITLAPAMLVLTHREEEALHRVVREEGECRGRASAPRIQSARRLSLPHPGLLPARLVCAA